MAGGKTRRWGRVDAAQKARLGGCPPGPGQSPVTREHFDALLYTGEDDAMRRLLHRDLMRGHKAQRAAIILLMGLLLVLVAAFFHGVFLLRA